MEAHCRRKLREKKVFAGVPNRLNKVVMFHPLRDRAARKDFGDRVRTSCSAVYWKPRADSFLFRLTSAAKTFLLKEGTDTRYGARHLKRAIERHLVYPLANFWRLNK